MATGATTNSAKAHSHSCSTTTDAKSNLPPYFSSLFIQRKTPAVSVSVGAEEIPSTGDFSYRKPVTITNSGSLLSNYDVVISFDTATLISQGKMQSDCDDIRVRDSDGSTELSYWIEGGCNRSDTQLWARVPSIPTGTKTVYVYYGKADALNNEVYWGGSFTLLSAASCSGLWTRNSGIDNRFPYGAITYGTTGGSSSHNHNTSTGNTNSDGTYSNITGGTDITTLSGRVHYHGGVSISHNANSSVWPPYLDMVLCSEADLVIPSGLIALYATSAPSGWTRFTNLDNSFPRGAATYGGAGGASTHTHTTNSDTTTGSSDTGAKCKTSGTGNRLCSTQGHTHTFAASVTAAADHTPPYLNMVFASANSQTMAGAGLIALVNSIPPLGWTRFTSLDSAFPRGAATYGGAGGASTHQHSTVLTSGLRSAAAGCNTEAPLSGRSGDHTHTYTYTTDAVSNLPPYIQVIFAQRNTLSATLVVGEEELIGEPSPTPSPFLRFEGIRLEGIKINLPKVYYWLFV
jgi:hypothetical protein